MSAIITDQEFLSEVIRRIDLHGDKNWIFTNSGTRVFLANPTVDSISLDDIAHGLSNLCRFNGQCNKFYNVAEHSTHVASVVMRATGDADLARAALMHDSPEAYLGDMTRPLKDIDIIYKILEGRFEQVIQARFSLEIPFHDKRIKRADYDVFFAEMDTLFDFNYEAWNLKGHAADVKIVGWDPPEAKKSFLNMASQLGIAA